MAQVIGIPSQEVFLEEALGDPWFFPMSLEKTRVVFVSVIRRGGMNNQNEDEDNMEEENLDDTEPYVNDGDYQEDMQDEAQEEQPYPVVEHWPHSTPRRRRSKPWHEHVRPPTRERSRSPINRDQPWKVRPNGETIHTTVVPRDRNVPMPDVGTRKIMYAGEKIGTVSGYNEADVKDVIAELELKAKFSHPIAYVPRHVAKWGQVAHVIIQNQIKVPSAAMDLRKGPYEAFQRPRVTPIFAGGIIAEWVVFGWHTTQQDAQDRLDRDSHWSVTWTLHVLAAENWVVTQRDLPHDIMQELNQRPPPWHEEHEEEEEEEEENDETLPMQGVDVVHGTTMQRALLPRRGGGKRSRQQAYAHPRSAMHGWALHQACQQCPQVAPATLNFLMKAEFRTITAVLGSKTAGQTAQVINAALVRAGLPMMREGTPYSAQRQQSGENERVTEQEAQTQEAPDQPELRTTLNSMQQPREDSSGTADILRQQLDTLIHLIFSQNETFNMWVATQTTTTSHEHLSLMQAIQSNGAIQAEAMKKFAEAMEKLERRIGDIESMKVPRKKGPSSCTTPRCPTSPGEGVPPTPEDQLQEQDLHDPGQQEGDDGQTELVLSALATNGGCMEEGEVVDVRSQDDGDEAKPSVLGELRNKSLRVQAAKAVGSAMAPFKTRA